MARRKALGEFDLIARLFAPLATHPGALHLRDDAAIIPRKSGQDLVVTKDAIVEGVHFLPGDPPDLVARKLLRVNVSDLAAKGARPAGYFLAVAFPKGAPAGYARTFAKGLAKDQKLYGLELFGGDTVATPGPAAFSCTMFGFVPRRRMLMRRGAKPGEDIWVTGTIGDSGAGLSVLRGALSVRGADADWLARRYRLPDPPIAFGMDVAAFATSALDVSDGLAQDAGHLARESGVKLQINVADIPLSPQFARASGGSIEAKLTALAAGDDYQILFTAPRRKSPSIQALARQHIIRVTRIGQVSEGRGVSVVDDRGRTIKLQKTGYTHF